MRIIGGEFRSRRLVTPKDASTTRPIPDRVKESLFGLLRGHTEGAAVFDAFAGTGAIGLEAVSRGAARCVFIERDRKIAEILRQNVENLGVEDRCEVVIGDALGPGALARCPRPARLIFFDPPYPLIRSEVGWKRARTQFERLIDLLADDGFAVLRTPWPFTIETGAEIEAPVERPKRGKTPRWQREGRDWDVLGQGRDAWPEDREGSRRPKPHELPGEEDEEAEGSEPEAEGRTLVSPDMTFANASGPETHIYHAMAVHLYAKRRQG